jgi:hypothetical protein
MLRKLVFKLTRGAYPSLKSKIDNTVRIEYGCALFARYWLILYERHVLDIFHRCIDSSYRNNNSSSSYFVARPKVPTKSDSVFNFSLVKVH